MWQSCLEGNKMDKNNINILLVEDNPGDARLIQEILSEAAYLKFNLDHADRISGGVELLSKKNIDVVLLDLGLPDGHGINTFEKIYKIAPAVPIVVLTGIDNETLGVEAVQKGAQDYLVKGKVDGSLLFRSILYAIERQKLIGELKSARVTINTLHGLLPICAGCKKIRDDKGSWNQIEKYIKERSDADFTHSMCPDCVKEYYPQLYGGKK